MKLKGAKKPESILDLSVVTLEKIPVANEHIGVITDIGVRVTCKKDGLETEFRCVFPETELMHFLDALYTVGRVTNLRAFKREMKWDDKPDWIPVSSTITARNPLAGTFIDPMQMDMGNGDGEEGVGEHGGRTAVGIGGLSASSSAAAPTGKGGKQYIIQQSAMRRAITKAMDHYDRNSRKMQTIARYELLVWGCVWRSAILWSVHHVQERRFQVFAGRLYE